MSKTTDRQILIEIIEKTGTYTGKSMGKDYYTIKINDLVDTILENGFASKVESVSDITFSIIKGSVTKATLDKAIAADRAFWKDGNSEALAEAANYFKQLQSECINSIDYGIFWNIISTFCEIEATDEVIYKAIRLLGIEIK